MHYPAANAVSKRSQSKVVHVRACACKVQVTKINRLLMWMEVCDKPLATNERRSECCILSPQYEYPQRGGQTLNRPRCLGCAKYQYTKIFCVTRSSQDLTHGSWQPAVAPRVWCRPLGQGHNGARQTVTSVSAQPVHASFSSAFPATRTHWEYSCVAEIEGRACSLSQQPSAS